MIEQYGRWVSEDVFEFFEERDLGDGVVMRQIDISHMFAPELDVTREMVIEAIINAQTYEVSYGPMMNVRCPDCGRVGVVPAQVLPGRGAEEILTMRCPRCRASEPPA